MLPAPFRDDLAVGPDGGSAYWIEAIDGMRTRVGVWPKGKKGTVLIFPGRTEYIEKYGNAAAEFSKMGYPVCAIDWRGQGIADRALTNRKIGHINKFTDFQQDVEAYMRAVKMMRLPEPYYLVAHSMGGCIGLRALNEGLPVAKAMFSAPMWGIKFTPPMRQVAWTISTLASHLPVRFRRSPTTDEDSDLFHGEFEANCLTTDEVMWNYMCRQVQAVPDFNVGGPSIQWLYEALREMNALFRMESPDYPTLTYLGTDEDVVDPTRIHERMGRWSNGELVLIEDARHEIMMETSATRRRFFEHAGDFFTP